MNIKPFNQPAPQLGNQYDTDRVLRSYLRRVVPDALMADSEPALREMGEMAGGELYELQLADRPNLPKLTQWDAWGERIDHIDVTAVWKRAEHLAAEFGVSRERVRQIEVRALEKVQRAVKNRVAVMETPAPLPAHELPTLSRGRRNCRWPCRHAETDST